MGIFTYGQGFETLQARGVNFFALGACTRLARVVHAPFLLRRDAFPAHFFPFFALFKAFFGPDFFLFLTRSKKKSWSMHGVDYLGSKKLNFR